MDCLTDETVLQIVQGKLSAAGADAAWAHVSSCARCRSVIAAAASAYFEEKTASTVLDAELTAGGSLPRSSILAPGGVVDRYVIGDLLGIGGAGTVYRAHDPRLARQVALKIIPGDGSSIPNPDLIREAQAMARLSHPNVVGVFDAGVVDGRIYVVMELVEGTTLSIWLKSESRTWQAMLAAFVEAGRGLAAAHDVGIVHGDFKPENVLMGADGRARVTDFGLAAMAWDPAKLPANISGTPAYMAPEQFLGRSIDHNSDQFSFCVALYRALYGQHPFVHSGGSPHTVRELMDAVVAGLVLPARKDLRIPPWVFRVISRGLDTNPGSRYPSMNELLSQLDRGLARARRWRRVVLPVAVAAAVVLGGTALWSQAANPVCGNRVVERGEQCDDGNQSNSDGCLSTCKFAACGDGQVRAGVEECDDGNQRGGDGCGSHCVRCAGGDAHLTLAQDGHCYTRHDKPQTWQGAAATCRSIGAHLVTFNYGFEIAATQNLIAHDTWYWIGFHDPLATRNYVWTTGETNHASFLTWLADLPQPIGGCVAIQRGPYGPPPLSGMSCGLEWGFVCEKDNWILRPETNHAYRAFGQEKTWDGARNLCQSIGAHLLTIADAQESAFIHARFAGPRWTGAIKSDSATGFRWITGELFSPSLFGPDDPNLATLPACVVLAEDLWLYDRPCDGSDRGSYQVICEID